MTDNNKPNKENERFFDVSFDQPNFKDNESYRHNDSQQRKSPSETNESKWDNFYEKFKEEERHKYQEDLKDFEDRPTQPNENLKRRRRPRHNSNVMLDRSIHKVKKLFQDLGHNDKPNYKEIKLAKTKNLAEREQATTFFSKSETNENPAPNNFETSGSEVNESRSGNTYLNAKQTPAEPKLDTEEQTKQEVNESKRLDPPEPQASSTFNINRLYSSDIPSPEEIRQMRERRRKLRIAELEKLTSEQEIESTFTSSFSSRWKQDHEAKPSPESEPIEADTSPNSNKEDVNIEKAVESTQLFDAIHKGNRQGILDTGALHFNDLDFKQPVEQKKVELPSTSATQQTEKTTENLEKTLIASHKEFANLRQANEEGILDTRIFENPVASITKPTEAEKTDIPVLARQEAYESEPVLATEDSNASEMPTEPRRSRREVRKEKMALKEYSFKEKTFFGINVTFNVFKKLIIYLILIIVLVGALIGGAGIGYFANLVSQTSPPSEQEMAEQINHFDQQSTMYYANGEPIANIRSDVVRSYVELDDISDYIIDGFIATEDEHFAEHPGVVPKAILRAVLETFVSGSGTGGSTLTQQLVKQQMLSNEVTFFRKANEILLALRLENYFSKEDILNAYLNVSPFGRNNNGDNVAGIAKAAEGIFGVAPADVTLNQAAFLAGLPQDPYVYTPYDQTGAFRERENIQPGIDRMNDVLYRMYREQKITKDEYEQAIAYDITQDFIDPEPREEERQSYLYQAIMHGAIEKLMLLNIADDGYSWQQVYSDHEWYNEYYFAAEEQLRTGGYKVYSTIDKEIYDQLQVSAAEYDDQLGVVYDGVYVDPETGYETYYIERVQTGMVVIDNQTGRVLGFVSGTDYENNQIDHAFQMRRSPGSTIKPLAVYGPAIEHDLVNPATIVPDTAYVLEFEDGSTWEPTNYGNAVSGDLMTVRRALLRSDNLPTVRIYEELLNRGVPVIDYLANMGFNTVDSYTEEDTQNLAFSLGGVTTGPTVFEETRAFTTFANDGEYVDGYYIERIEDSFGNVVFQQNQQPRRVFSEDTNYLVVDMLRDTMDQGTGRTAQEYMNVPGDWIAKTGISENSKDIWVIASTPAVTIGSWVGYDSRYADYTIDVNDGYGLESVRSQIFWANVVNDLYATRPDIFGTELTFQQPNSVQEQTILEQTGTLPGTMTYNGNTYQLTGPTRTDLFKVSNPAPPLTYDFIFAGRDDDFARFWSGLTSQEELRRRQIEEQRRQQEAEDDADEDDEDSDDESGDESGDGDDESPDDPGVDPGSEVPPPPPPGG